MELKKNREYRCLGFKHNISPAYRRKLLSMGISPGKTFKVKSIALMGSPVQLEACGAFLSLRKIDLNNIKFESNQ